MITKNNVIELLKSLELPSYIINLYLTNERHPQLKYSMGVPEEFFSLTDEEQKSYGNNAIPIWDNGDFGYVTFYDTRRNGFVRIDVELEETVDDLPVCSYQQIIVYDLYFIWDCEHDIDILKDVSDTLGFQYIKQMMEVVQSESYNPDTFVESFQNVIN